MGNLDSLRDWGHAKDYVRMQWLMLQQEQPEDFVIATGVQYSVRQFIEMSAKKLGFSIAWSGHGVEEVGLVDQIAPEVETDRCPALKSGMVIIRIDPRYFRATEVETLLGDATKARDKLGWSPEITLIDMVAEMVESDLLDARRAVMLKKVGLEK
jgi:GDPmannose 4,6-dehydratase